MAEMTFQMATEIVAQATKHGAFEITGLDPSIDPTALSVEEIKGYLKFDEPTMRSEAANLVQLARNACDRGIESDAVLEILFAALIEPTAVENKDVLGKAYARHGVDMAEKFSGTAAPTAPSGFEAAAGGDQTATAEDHDSIDDIFPGYDDKKVAEIKKLVMESAASGDLTPDEWAKIKAHEAANEERKSILSLDPQFKPAEPPPAPSSGFPGSAAASPSEMDDYGDRNALEAVYQNGSLGGDRVTQERLPLPPQYNGEEPILPVDVTAISDEELTRLVMRFHSLEARAIFLASQEAGRRDVAEGLARDCWNDAFAREFSRLKSAIEKETGTAVENARSEAKHLAEVDDHVRTWRTRALRHAAEARTLDSLASGWEKANARLSREQSRREKLAGTRT